MSTRMLIDAAHPEETRVAVVSGNRIEEFDFEAATKSTLRGNIYLARVTRVEPSLQAAFVEYGGNRHGFLAFSEIHPDYYQIPVEDRQALLEEEEREHAENDDDPDEDGAAKGGEEGDGQAVEELGSDDSIEESTEVRRKPVQRRYKIQEVIKKRQILLVQVVKEERGNKGAALTTYLSLAGRYCVLMPNTARGGGISRKIPNHSDRKKLKKIMSELEVPKGMGCIIRTAGASRNKTEIKRDYTYLTRLWDSIRELTLNSIAPALIYEEGDLIKRTIRDVYSNDVTEVLVEGADGYRAAKDFMKMLMPSHAKRVQQYKDSIPLFHRYQVESQLEIMYSASVPLKSGGYLVINPTEALVAIDVNSGRSTRERNIERTALKTNLEAAQEVARQLRLRDLAGLIVIDFIDMEDNRNNRSVERKMKECLKNDRARLQVGRISPFGLMEMSRQRLRPGLLEASTETCPVCDGTGAVRSTESSALQIMRVIEDEGIRGRTDQLTIRLPADVAAYLLNQKRQDLVEVEQSFKLSVTIEVDEELHRPHYELTRGGKARTEENENVITLDEFKDPVPDDAEEDDIEEDEAEETTRQEKSRQEASASDDDGQPRKRRRRGRRGGRRRRKNQADGDTQEQQAEAGQSDNDDPSEADKTPQDDAGDDAGAEAAEQDAADPGAAQQPEVPVEDVAEWQAASETAETPDADSADFDEAETDDTSDTSDDDESADQDTGDLETLDQSGDEPADEAGDESEDTTADASEVEDDDASPEEDDAGTEVAEEQAADAPEPVAVDEAPADDEKAAEDSAEPEEDDDRPKRTGWWDRAAGE